MQEMIRSEAERSAFDLKLSQSFEGKTVRKDLSNRLKEGALVPGYVLEYLLGKSCGTDNTVSIEHGMERVRRFLAKYSVRSDEAQKVLSDVRREGSRTILDRVTVRLNMKKDRFEAELACLGLRGIPIPDEYPWEYERLLGSGIWCAVELQYDFDADDKSTPPIHIESLKPAQLPHSDLTALKRSRRYFTREEWVDLLLRSTGLEPERLSERSKWLLLARMLPLVENNLNLCEFGPRSTGKSHLYKEFSPYSILVSGGQSSTANLFCNLGRNVSGLVSRWDCVAFDEVGGMNLKDHNSVQIMKDYMASGSFTRGAEEKTAFASMMFIGNINAPVAELLQSSTLFEPFPRAMGTDTAFLDRIHGYIPGWEIPKLRPESFAEGSGLISDYLAGALRELRKEQRGDAFDAYFRLGKALNQRDSIAVRKLAGGFTKLLYPDGVFTREQAEEVLRISLELRRRVKEQMKKLDGEEFGDVEFSYIDRITGEERFVSVPEQEETDCALPSAANRLAGLSEAA